MTAFFGSVGEFYEEKEEWRLDIERMAMEYCLNANGIQDESEKYAAFLSTVGPRAYKLLGSLMAPVSRRVEIQTGCGADGTAFLPEIFS